MREKITKETLEKHGFVKDAGSNIWRLDDQINCEYISVVCFDENGENIWVCLASKFKKASLEPLLDHNDAHTSVIFIEDIQLVMNLLHMQYLHIFEQPEFVPS